MRISYSTLETFNICPQKYKFQEIDRIRAPKSKEAVFGTLVHDTLKFMFNSPLISPSLDEVLDYYKSHWIKNTSFADEREEQSYFAEGVRILSDYYRKNNPKNIRPLALETRFEITLPNKNDPLNPHILVGKIDRIDKLENDDLEIIDYKTAMRMPSQDEIDKNLQLSFYNLGVRKMWPEWQNRKIKLSLYFLRHEEKLSSVRTEEDLELFKKYIQNATEIISKSGFKSKLSPLCDWCAYKQICPLWKHLYKKPEEETPSDVEIKDFILEYYKIKKEDAERKKRLMELASKINKYLNENNLEQIFAQKSGFSIMRSFQERYAYDFEKIQQILEPLNDWVKILSPDSKKLKELLKELPPHVRDEINFAHQVAKKIAMLKIRKVGK